MTPEEIQALEPGIYIDGHWGQYGPARLILITVDLGWAPRHDAKDGLEKAKLKLKEMGPGVDQGLTADDEELILWTAELAEEWLNENRRPDHLLWQWYEGEFGLWPEEEDDVAI